MAVSYKPLWIELAKRDLRKKDIQIMANLTSNLIANMGKNEYISMKNLEKICKALDCTPNDVFEFIQEVEN
ncbi:helix-turn-helix domain-containing protein [Clostridium faecium]|jgi:putative transcriptional regulator|uniref:Helix-turn-helix transcriptional regulator n=1 Tax=Clostridium faecium TaxID=2762223 RepID=A0ABR8YV63_9CLOT|nr:helix-turn-helix transcriptional regulator [Clostridium faecium]MBD8048125.1 helix-turn-helix transcriptional regulator [Clostridium faecium]